ncbi:MAG TPA: hypothetical protein VD862_00960 [Candidatus Paceibacterota bacterium]|nr:hypothetical protein [Candidatus Paceibacterota bacterium]
MKRLIPAVAAVLVFGAGGPAVAGDVDLPALSAWLCEVLPGGEPQNRLDSFPGAPGGTVRQTKNGEPFVLRSGKGTGTLRYEWTYVQDDWKVTWNFSRRTRRGRTSTYGFTLSIRPSSRGTPKSFIFTSEEQAADWLSRLGGGYRTEDDDEGYLYARDAWDADYEGYGWEVGVNVGEQVLNVDMFDPVNIREARRFCSID